MERKHIYTNELQKTAKTLNAGDTILLSGTIYTARDAAHKRMFEALDYHLPLPFDLKAHPSPGKPSSSIIFQFIVGKIQPSGIHHVQILSDAD